MSNRYSNTQIILNNSDSYSDIVKRKNLKSITQYSSFDFGKLKELADNNDIDSVIHVVQPYEKLFMISQKYYGMPDYGWLICYTNKVSNELQISIGDTLIIYFPLDKLLELF